MSMTIYHNHLRNELLDRLLENLLDAELEYTASELFVSLGLIDPYKIDAAVARAIQICQTASIPVRNNFKPVYMSSHGQIVCDWRLSPLARKLVILNADASHPLVAKVQVELLKSVK